uniref:Protein kinase domain-containing protein n=1 Tax=Parastrongyloides trichosuri TaxID=131310 RepID=A0A0N4Z9C0_PARTI
MDSVNAHSLESTQKSINKEVTPNNEYILKKVLREGEFATVHLCVDKNGTEKIIKFLDEKSYAAEMNMINEHLNTIKSHFNFNVSIQSFDRFNNILDNGRIEGMKYPFIVIEKLGDNLNDIRKECKNYQVETMTAIRLLIDALSIIEYLHNLGYVHQSIKPSSFCCRIDSGKKFPALILTNFETCSVFSDKESDNKENERLVKFGKKNFKYCSINQHYKEQIYQPKDDIESWCYIGILLFEGSLPWIYKDTEHEKEIIDLKDSLTQVDSDVFYEKTPIFFREFIYKVRKDPTGVDIGEFNNTMMKMISKFSECLFKKETNEKVRERPKMASWF